MTRGAVNDEGRPTDGIETIETDDLSTIRMWGEIDGALRGQASTAMARCLALGRPVVVDVSGITFIDSSGLAFLLQLHQVGQEEGMPVTLVDPPVLLVDLLEMIGMGDVVPVTWSAGRGPGPGGEGATDDDAAAMAPV